MQLFIWCPSVCFVLGMRSSPKLKLPHFLPLMFSFEERMNQSLILLEFCECFELGDVMNKINVEDN